MTVRVNATAQFEQDGALTIAASRLGLVELAQALATSVDRDVVLRPVERASPHITPVDVLRVRIDNKPGLAIRRSGSDVLIEGDGDAISLLAENIGGLGADAQGLGSHLHIEYFPGHFYLRADSCPAVVEVI